ncbi:8-amino-7-oxononanoate synthase [Phaeobacter inhibens]|uniref:8-amino-7-oxononanoate synthase n=1 Tax=Phaeobacter inhibens TaxID=221822 RepID=UPI0021A2F0DB|nr:8-amino-7-oxononanoate synthase [Phaeobacter inhibens]UWR53884.1 8-amino-7-oxononanoate synthase [Phaeobacter inhibens]UWR73399.1 8-amino-7-oxononanoate synthase [Phaeobacter inhibens]UWR77264.1 8-amino-7-oxononanoate synthase [Phaeobacter inhibens]UWR93315.1 8-amino-7-oxononanoate synthase [Phaeobacter inhibens]
MAGAFPRHETSLEALRNRGRYRQLMPRDGHDFASNDYLGLAGSDVLRAAAADALARGVPVGAGGSRLLRGNDAEHQLLEAEAAAFFGAEAALFMGGGFNANQAIFSTLPQQGDLVLYDALIHASTHDGMRLGRAETRSFAHGDVEGASRVLADWRSTGGTGQVWIAVEAVYSMDGDLAPLDALMALCDADGAVLVVDEAHSTGVFGDLGRGLAHGIAHRPNVLSLHTCGKALGASGALICGQRVLIETLINKARGFIFATAPSPLNAALVRAALAELQQNTGRREQAWQGITHAQAEAKRLCGLEGYHSQILPVVIGDDKRTMALAAAMQGHGYDIRGIRPPTVPRGTSRLRLSITLNTGAQVITRMFEDLAREMETRP